MWHESGPQAYPGVRRAVNRSAKAVYNRGMAEPRGTGRVTLLVNAAGNFLGAAVAFLYFRLVDPHAASLPRVRLHEVVHPLLVFAGLLALGNWLNNRWVAPINRATQGHPLSERETALVRRRALLFPYVLAGVSFAGWVVAGLIWGFGMPLADGTRRLAARQHCGSSSGSPCSRAA